MKREEEDLVEEEEEKEEELAHTKHAVRTTIQGAFSGGRLHGGGQRQVEVGGRHEQRDPAHLKSRQEPPSLRVGH